MRACTCGCTVVEESVSMGMKFCTGCGTVLEESAIVSDLAFKETSGGGCSLVGQFVRDGGLSSYLLPSLRLGGTVESREVTISKARKEILRIASQLNLNQYSVDMAVRFYKMALQRHLTMGRPVKIVTAAFLYISCRLQSTPYMLIDFCDVIEVNLFDLGRMFTFMAHAFHITLPPTDPSMYVMRFAQKMDFADKERQVVTLALRIIKKMQHDWIVIGRRPAGICGAALLLSARYHGIPRTIKDVIRVVHVCATVVKQRLCEFAITPSAQLTLKEFPLIDVEESIDPPSFKRELNATLEETWSEKELDDLSEELLNAEVQLSSALQKNQPRRGRPKLSAFSEDTAHLDPLSALVKETTVFCKSESNFLAPTPQFLGIGKEPIEKETGCQSAAAQLPRENDFAVSDIDDDEIEMYLLDKCEVEWKTRLWNNLNGEYYEQFEKRQAEKQMEESKKKVTKKRKLDARQANVTTNETIKTVLVDRKLSKKINYDVLKCSSSDDESETPAQRLAKASAAYNRSKEIFIDDKKNILRSVKMEKLDKSPEKPIESTEPCSVHSIRFQLPVTQSGVMSTFSATSTGVDEKPKLKSLRFSMKPRIPFQLKKE